MGRLTSAHKVDLQAWLLTFDYSGIECKLSYNLIWDFKTLTCTSCSVPPWCVHDTTRETCLAGLVQSKLTVQIELTLKVLLPHPYLFCTVLLLLQVFRIAYCQSYRHSAMHENQQVCINFMHAVKEAFPELQKKVKVHLFLHLAQDMRDFGPTSTFSAGRYGYVEVFITCTGI